VAKQAEETMGQKLQQSRKAAGLSQPQLAARAGVPISTLRNWEQDRRIPRLDTATKVAKAIGCSLDDLAAPVELPTAKDAPAKKRGRPKKAKE
jgi:transcriptional regulator with XRE-family HTH domain